MTPRETALLERAAHEAARAGWLWTAPNPRVGALALRAGHVVGYGHHARLGGPHAEESALRDAGAWDEEAGRPLPGRVDEMAVTLEPCSASGPGKRRPPCVELLRAAGVRRLVVGTADPDPRHRGRGLDALRAAGVEVVLVAAFEERFRRANPAFLGALEHPERPWVLAKWAASMDGKTAAENGASRWISGPAARAEVHRLRALGDAVLAGPRTLRLDDPALTARPGGAPAAHQPLRVLLAPDGRVEDGARVLQEPGPRLWWLREDAEPCAALARRLAGDADSAWFLPGPRVDLGAALARLRAERGVRRLLVEGGARLQGALLDAGLLDAVLCYQAPLLLGGGHGALLGRGFPEPARAPALEEEERADLGADLRRAFLVRERA